jgi:hypothetical protein
MEHAKESSERKSDRELLNEVLLKLSKIEGELTALRFDVSASKIAQPTKSKIDIGSLGGYGSSQSGY